MTLANIYYMKKIGGETSILTYRKLPTFSPTLSLFVFMHRVGENVGSLRYVKIDVSPPIFFHVIYVGQCHRRKSY